MVHFSSFKYRNVFIPFSVAAFDLMAMVWIALIIGTTTFFDFIYICILSIACWLLLHTSLHCTLIRIMGRKISLAVHRNISTSLVTKFSPKRKNERIIQCRMNRSWHWQNRMCNLQYVSISVWKYSKVERTGQKWKYKIGDSLRVFDGCFCTFKNLG